MALKAAVTDINAIPEAFRGEYKQVGTTNEWRLDIEGDVPGWVPNAKFVEFRDNNKTLIEEKKALATKLESLKDIDPEEYRKLKEGKKPSETEEQFKKRLEEALKPVQTELETTKQTNVKLVSDITRLRINDAAIAAGNELGLRPGAAVDLVGRVAAVAKLEGDAVIITDEKGDKRYKGSEVMTIRDLVGEVLEKAPYLFEPSTGTGANGNQGKGGTGTFTGSNPYDRKGGTFNLTAQGDLEKKNPALAKKLAGEVGVKLTI